MILTRYWASRLSQPVEQSPQRWVKRLRQYFTFGHTLAGRSRDGTVRLWDLPNLAHATPLGPPLTSHTNYVNAVAFTPDGHTLARGSGDHTVRLWKLTDPAHPHAVGPASERAGHRRVQAERRARGWSPGTWRLRVRGLQRDRRPLLLTQPASVLVKNKVPGWSSLSTRRQRVRVSSTRSRARSY